MKYQKKKNLRKIPSHVNLFTISNKHHLTKSDFKMILHLKAQRNVTKNQKGRNSKNKRQIFTIQTITKNIKRSIMSQLLYEALTI